MSYVFNPLQRVGVHRWAVVFLGLTLFSASMWHYSVDSGAQFATTMETVTLAGLSLSVVAIGVSLARNSPEISRVETTLRYSLLGTVCAALLTGWIILVLDLQNVTIRDVSFVTLTMTAVGASAGTFFGVNYDRLNRRTDALVEQNNRLDAFAGIVGHDLRNPLNKAQGHLEQARQTGNSEHFLAVERAHDQMERLIREIGGLAEPTEEQLHAGELEAVHPIDVRELATSEWESLQTDRASLRILADDPIVAEDRRLRVLFRNLFRNAIEHAGRDVTVVVNDLDDGFFVEDDGDGVPLALRERVWQGGFTTTEANPGFGLSIVRRIAEAHGWRVMIEEGTDGGARFVFNNVERGSRQSTSGTTRVNLLS